MPRPRCFDPDRALDDALAVFWREGYEGASLSDLTAATGLSRSSLYATWGDKHGLYLAALDRYRQQGHAVMRRLLADAPSALEGLRAYFRLVAEDASRMGCFVVSAAAERGATCADTAARTEANWHGLTQALADVVRRAQAEGDVAASLDAEATGRALAALVYGTRGMQNAGATPDAVDDVIARTLGALLPGV